MRRPQQRQRPQRLQRQDTAYEGGYTLVELLMVIAILAVITSLLVGVVYQFLLIPRQGNAQLALSHDLRNAGLWLFKDGNESASFAPGGACGTFDTGRGVLYSYDLNGSALQRTESSSGRMITIAHYVSGLSCSSSGRTVTINLTVSKGSVSDNAIYTVTMRVQQP